MPADAPEPSMQLLAEAAQNESRILKNGTTPIMDQDDRSSSLSDLDDRPATEGTDNQKSSPSPVSEDDDTEAETERVEESPYKREQKNILLSSNESLSNGASNNATTALVDDDPKTDTNPSRNEVDEAIHISDISSLEDSGDEGSGPESPSSVISKKRKRFVDDETSTSLKKASMKLTSHAADQAAHDDDSPSPPADKISVNGEQAGDIEEGSEDEEEESDHDKNEGDDVAINERMDIDGEDADMEDAGGPEADVEQAGRNEEERKLSIA